MIEMTHIIVEKICFQEEIPIILITSVELGTYIKGHHVYKEIWNPKLGEELNARIEANNLVDKFALCVEKDGNIVGYLKKGVSGKTVFYLLGSDNYSNCFAKVSGKRCNLKDGEGLQVPCYLYSTGRKSFVEVLELQKINEFLVTFFHFTKSSNNTKFFPKGANKKCSNY